MNPFSKPITFSEKKLNHFYCIEKDGEYIKIESPKKGDKVFEVATVSGGSNLEKKSLILQIPIPLCEKHQHDGVSFGVKTCSGWEYIVIPTQLGSLRCRECHDELFIPQPYLRSANLRSADLSYANLSYANLSYANLSYANLSSADLSSADLRYADLRSANLRSANLRSADLSYADLRSADLSYADLRSADLSYADLRSADLSYADLSSADLSYADLSSANLRSADLSYADLSSADLRSADLSSAKNINESFNLDTVYWDKFTIIDKQFKKLLNKRGFLQT